MEESDILINIGNTIDNQVPSKIFDYISKRKPIINLYKISNCPSLKYLKKYPLALNLEESDKAFAENKEKINCFLKDLDSLHKISTEDILNIYQDCTPSYCANRFKEIIEKSL